MPSFLLPPPPKKGVTLSFVSFDELYHLWHFRVSGPIFSVRIRQDVDICQAILTFRFCSYRTMHVVIFIFSSPLLKP